MRLLDVKAVIGTTSTSTFISSPTALTSNVTSNAVRITQQTNGSSLLKKFDRPPPYAILSHRWSTEEMISCGLQETTFQDIMAGIVSQKIINCCIRANYEGYDWVWIDTCCIDKSNSSELSEAINSMFAWYRNSDVCYAYLDDVRTNEHDRFRNSEWFMRGWTLQELLAPMEVVFFDEDWNYIGTRGGLADKISEVTRIPRDVLLDSSKITKCSVAQRMSWAADRRTTMEEDRAYSLMGLFGIYMPAIYGERKYAFIRLQEEIMRHYDDQSIFSWNMKSGRPTAHGPLAPSPSYFRTPTELPSVFHSFRNSDRRFQPEKIHVENSPPPSSILLDFTACNRLVFHIPHQMMSNLDVKGLAPERLWTKGQNGGMNLTITGLRDVCCGTAIFQDRRTKAAFAIILGANRVVEDDDSRVAWVDIASVAYDETVGNIQAKYQNADSVSAYTAVSHTVSKAFGTYNIEAMIKLNPIQESVCYTVSIRRRMISPRHSIEKRNVVSSFRDRKHQQALRC